MIRCRNWTIASAMARARAAATGRRQLVLKVPGYHLGGHYVSPTWTVQEAAAHRDGRAAVTR